MRGVLFIVRHDHPSLARYYILSYIEAEASEFPESSGLSPVVLCLNGMGAIFDYLQPVPGRQRLCRPCRKAGAQNGRGRCSRSRRDPALDLIRVNVHRPRIEVGEDRIQACVDDGIDRGAEGHGGGDHLIAGLQTGPQEAQRGAPQCMS